MNFVTRLALVSCAVFFAVAPMTHAQTATSTNLLSEIRASLGTATSSAASSFSRDGIFGCTGSSYGAVGAQGPTGAYVPVFDSALFDQQRLLTYKECLLDGIANSAKEALISNLVQVTVEWAQTGNNGQSAFVTDLQARRIALQDPVYQQFMQEIDSSNLSELDKRDVKEALSRSYAQDTGRGTSTLTCPLSTAQIEAVRSGDFFGAGGFSVLYKYNSNPACSKQGAYLAAKRMLDDRLSQAIADDNQQLNWGSGFPSITQDRVVDLGNGQTAVQKQIVTPGYLIAQQLSQVLGTGLRQAENATEIDTLISSTLANLGTRMLTDVNGLTGLATAFGGQPSYVARLATDAANRTREKMVGAAAAVLNNTITTEQEFGRAQTANMSVFNNARTQLEKWENTCYVDMAKTHATEVLKKQVCPQPEHGQTPVCSTTITTSTTYAPDVIIVSSPTPATLTVQGYASRPNSRIEVTTGVGSSTPLSITPDADGAWSSDPIDISGYEDGSYTIAATEYFADGSGTYGPISALISKSTTSNGVEIETPTERPNLTVTATGAQKSESVTLSQDATRSRDIADANITPNLARVYRDVTASQKALAVLVQMRAALAAATTATGQREVLDILDQLVARHLLHSESDLRSAEGQGAEIGTAMSTLLEQTRTNWEASWCQPDNWSAHVVQ